MISGSPFRLHTPDLQYNPQGHYYILPSGSICLLYRIYWSRSQKVTTSFSNQTTKASVTPETRVPLGVVQCWSMANKTGLWSAGDRSRGKDSSLVSAWLSVIIPLGTRHCRDVKSTPLALIQRRNNVVCPVGWHRAMVNLLSASLTRFTTVWRGWNLF